MARTVESPLLCPGCNGLNRVPGRLAFGGETSLSCARCGETLQRNRASTVERVLAFSLAGLICGVTANFYPVLTFTFHERSQSNYLLTGPEILFHGVYQPVAALIVWTSVLAPVLKMLGLLLVAGSLRTGGRVPGLGRIFKWTMQISRWGLIEVYAAAILVAIAKLDQMGASRLDPGAWLLAGLFVCSLLAGWSLDEQTFWNRIRRQGEAKP
ncbi:MAG: paraquat-inducible protein A [Verrucomicrobiae bacterium]|nr:paraquat-inducible protein A [Verrucomicrobiae bacterium]